MQDNEGARFGRRAWTFVGLAALLPLRRPSARTISPHLPRAALRGREVLVQFQPSAADIWECPIGAAAYVDFPDIGILDVSRAQAAVLAPQMPSDPQVTPEQLAQERSIRFALLADLGVLALALPVGLLGGSLTIKAEAIRFVLGMSIEIFAYTVMWRLHRGKLQDLEFGGGKLEQIANLVTGLGMLGAAAWIAAKAMAIVSGHGEVGTPLGLALAAMVGALNAYINFLAWDRMRSAAEGGSSLVMQGQVNARRVKLVCSLVVLFTMTVAALSTDNVVVASADAVGSVFVAAFMVINGSDMLRTGVPDLLDRSAGKTVRDTVDRVLAGSAGHYERLDRVRSRRSGRVVFVEIVLSFEPGLIIAEVNRRIAALKQSMADEIEHADISILTTGAAIA